VGATTRDRKPALAAGGWPAGPISRRVCSRERRTGERPTGGPERQRQQVSGLRGVIPIVGRIRGSQPKLGFSFFSFYFLFLFLFYIFPFHLSSNFKLKFFGKLSSDLKYTFEHTNLAFIYNIYFVYIFLFSNSFPPPPYFFGVLFSKIEFKFMCLLTY
jgi:hypothetical protein